MKKLLSIILAVLMVVPSLFIASAETTEKSNQSILREYLQSIGVLLDWVDPEYSYAFREIGTVGKYTLCHGSGTFTHETNYETVIGDYKITTTKEYDVNPLALYLIDGETVHTFNAEAYEKGIINDSELDEIIALIEANKGPHIFYGWTIKNISPELILEERYPGHKFNIVTLGEIYGYRLYYNDTSYLQFLTRNVVIGEYKFNIFANQTPYDMGLYVISDDTAYTFEEAYEAGIITNLDAVYEMITARDDIHYNFTMERITVTPPVDEPEPSVTVETGKLKAGEKVKLFKVVNPKGERITYTAKTSDIATVNKKGVVTGLQKGKADFVITVGEEEFNCRVKVTSNPKLMKNNKKVKSIKVNRKETVKLQLVGKVKKIKNVYTNTKKAKITSGKNATTIKVKGLKKGTTTLKIKVNGVKTLKLKVTVK